MGNNSWARITFLGAGIPRAGNGLEAVVPNPDGAPGAVDFADFHVAPVCRFP